MKKILSLVLVFIFALSLTACGNESVSDNVTENADINVSQDNSQIVVEQLQLVDSGYTVIKNDEYVNIYYGVEIKNPNEKFAIEYPSINITAKSADGKILYTEEQVINCVAANDTIYYGDCKIYRGEKASTVELSVSASEDNIQMQDNTIHNHSSEFEVSNTSDNSGTFTGEVKNLTDNEKNVAISVVLKKDEKIIGGIIDFVDDIPSKGVKAFSIYDTSDDFGSLIYDSYIFCAINW